MYSCYVVTQICNIFLFNSSRQICVMKIHSSDDLGTVHLLTALFVCLATGGVLISPAAN